MVLLVPVLQLVKGVVIAGQPLEPVQCRMARAALGWSLVDLATAAAVDRKTVLRFEQGERNPRAQNLSAIRNALERAGVRFIEEGADAGGVVPPTEPAA